MQMYKKLTLIASVLAGSLAVPAVAGHANPWATSEDTVFSQYHDINQARSIGTPGEDRMLGVMTRNAYGKMNGGSKQRQFRERTRTREHFRQRSAVPSGGFGRGNGGGRSGRP